MSDVAVCNSALVKVGAGMIGALNEGSVNANLCTAMYATLRDDVLRSHPWKFAIKRALLASTMTVPVYDYSNQLTLPTDCLRVIGTDFPGEDWIVEGGFLYGLRDGIQIRYISQVTDPTMFDSNFGEALACRVAAELAYSLVQSVTLKAALMQDYEKQLAKARSFSAQEGSSPRVYADDWLNSRY